MTDAQAKLLAFPLVMIAGSLYSMVNEEYALLMGGIAFVVGGLFFISEWARTFRSRNDVGRRNADA